MSVSTQGRGVSVADVIVEFDTEAVATYFRLTEAEESAETIELADDLMVDLDEDHNPIGVELLRRPSEFGDGLFNLLAGSFPAVADEVKAAIEALGPAV
ncbi:MAG: hypothetical protein JWM85_550 [Acidimicrobiaceae bacterium]|nr:hypothetical protein [Acidimicrobiaceae bacterium]